MNNTKINTQGAQLVAVEVAAERDHPVGIFAGKSNTEYHGGPGVSKSGLDIVRRSLAHFKHVQDQRDAGVEREETAAMRVGSAEHGILLESAQFEKEFALPFDASEWLDAVDTVPELKERLKALGLPVGGNKPDLIERLREADPSVHILEDLKAMHAEDSAGKTILTKAQWSDVRGMRNAEIENPTICKFLTDPLGQAEQSAYWRDEETGLLLRCRPDLWVGDVVMDIKTTDDARRPAFERSIEKWRAVWRRGSLNSTLIDRQKWMAASEKTGGRPGRLSRGARQVISLSTQISREPRFRSDAL